MAEVKVSIEKVFNMWFGEVRAAVTGLLVKNPNYTTGYYHKKGNKGLDELIQNMSSIAEHLNGKLDELEGVTMQYVVPENPHYKAFREYAQDFSLTEHRANSLLDSLEATINSFTEEQVEGGAFVLAVRKRLENSTLSHDERAYVFFVLGALLHLPKPSKKKE